MLKQKKLVGILIGAIVFIVLVGIYKSGYLSNRDKNNVNGNKVSQVENINNQSNQTISTKQNKTISHLISPAEFKKKVDSGEYVVVDIRTPEEFQNEKIPGAKINIDFYNPGFKGKVARLDKNKKYLYYCRSGHRSGEASALAKELGFNVAYELKGGINAWKQAGYKTN